MSRTSPAPDGGRPFRRAAPSEGKAEGFLGEVARPGVTAVEESCLVPGAPELKGARERQAWAPSCLHLGCSSSPGSQQVSLGKVGLTLGPERQEALVAWPCRAGLGQGRAGQWRPGPRSGSSWHRRQEVRGVARVSACGNLLFSSVISPGPSETGATKKETQSLWASLGTS